jgi:hypothetical protein
MGVLTFTQNLESLRWVSRVDSILGFRKALTSWLLIRENSKCFLLGAPGDE